jgi:hypothetical protein
MLIIHKLIKTKEYIFSKNILKKIKIEIQKEIELQIIGNFLSKFLKMILKNFILEKMKIYL